MSIRLGKQEVSSYLYTDYKPDSSLFKQYTEETLTEIQKEDLDGIKKIRGYSFYDAELKHVDLADSIKIIEMNAFYSNPLINITLPKHLTTIGSNAFAYCTTLESIVIPISVETIRENVFSNCSKLIIYCEAEEKPSNWNDYWNSSNCPVVWNYLSTSKNVNNITYHLSDTTLTATPILFDVVNLTEIKIEKEIINNENVYEVFSLPKECLINNTTVETLTLPFLGKTRDGDVFGSGVGIIYAELSYLFSSTGFTPETLKNLVITNANIIPANASNNIDTIETVILNEGITEIGNDAFYHCGLLREISLPQTLIKIGDRVFQYCNKLEKIIFSGTKEQWNAIEKGDYWNYGTSYPLSFQIHCSDGII